MYRKLILKFVVDERGLDHKYVVVSCNILNPYLVENNLVHFYARLLLTLLVFVVFC